MMSNPNLNDVKSFVVYYGRNNVEKLSRYDLAVVEPIGQSEDNIKYMKKNGTIVIGYISVLEICKCSPDFKYLREEDFLKINGEKIINETYDNYLVDLRSKRWNAMLIQRIGDLLLNKKYDGIFLDTVGDIEFDSIPKNMKNSIINALVNLLLKVRELFNDCIIIQNNGIVELIKYTGTLVDGIVWENPPINAFNALSINSKMVEFVKLLNYKYHIRVFILIDETYILKNSKSYEVIRSICDESDLLFYISGKDYLE